MVNIAQVEPGQLPAVREMLYEYLAFTRTLDDLSGQAPTFHDVDNEIESLPGVYAPPRGRLLIATVDGEVAGSVALKPHDDKLSELKRLYVRPQFRGHKLG